MQQITPMKLVWHHHRSTHLLPGKHTLPMQPCIHATIQISYLAKNASNLRLDLPLVRHQSCTKIKSVHPPAIQRQSTNRLSDPTLSTTNIEPIITKWHIRLNPKQPAVFAKRKHIYDEWNVTKAWKQSGYSWDSNFQWKEYIIWQVDCSNGKGIQINGQTRVYSHSS